MLNKQHTFYRNTELAARWYVCLMLNAYGLGKLFGKQFYLKGHLPPEVGSQTLDNVDSFDLAWAFMGYSYSYVFFIGASQVLGACLLLFNKTKLLGVTVLIPVLLNIIVFDAIFFNKFYAALVSSCFYFLLILYILYFNRLKLKAILQILFLNSNKENKSLLTIAMAAIITLVFFGIDQLVQNLFRI